MNKRIRLLFVLLIGTTWLHAQGPVRDRIKTLKVAFLTERIGLTSQEAQQFWPIYNEHEDALENIRRKEMQSRLSAAQGLSDSETDTLLDNLLALETEKYNANQSFISRMRKVISPKKMLLLLKAEDDFKKRLLQQYRRKQGEG